MSDSDHFANIQRITAKKLLEFLKKRTSNKGCPECDNDEMEINTVGSIEYPEDILPVGFHALTLPDQIGFLGMKKYFVVNCGNCGFTKLFDADIIAKIINNDKELQNIGSDDDPK